MRCRDQYLQDDKTTSKYYDNYEAAPQGRSYVE